MDSATRTLAGQPFVIKLTDIETEAGWRLSRAGIELNGVVRPDWAGRPSVPADVATELYGQLVEERARLANEQARESDERVARLERVRPLRGGIPALPGLNAPAADVMRAFDADRSQQ